MYVSLFAHYPYLCFYVRAYICFCMGALMRLHLSLWCGFNIFAQNVNNMDVWLFCAFDFVIEWYLDEIIQSKLE